MIKSNVWKSIKIGDVTLKNRVLRSATHEGLADITGRPTEKLKDLYIKLAKGEVGAIITGYAGVQQDGKSPFYHMLMIDRDELIPSYKSLTDSIKEYGVPVFLQIAHCGRATREIITGKKVVAPSAIKDYMYPETPPKELTEVEIEEIINNFISATIRAKKAGFSGIQLHIAHGYLLAQFLSRHSNRRTDRWGGSLESRFLIIKKILQGIRAELPDYPILAKINAYDYRKNGMRLNEAVEVSKLLVLYGCSAIEVSCGVPEDLGVSVRGPKLPLDAAFQYHHQFNSYPKIIKTIGKRVLPMVMKNNYIMNTYNVDEAVVIKSHVNIPVFVVGGINSSESIYHCIDKKGLDGVSMSRPLILEPSLVKKIKDHSSVKSKCIKCNYCGVIQENKPIKCYYGKLPKETI